MPCLSYSAASLSSLIKASGLIFSSAMPTTAMLRSTEGIARPWRFSMSSRIALSFAGSVESSTYCRGPRLSNPAA